MTYHAEGGGYGTKATTQLAKMSIDPKFVALTADALEIFL